MCHGMGLTASAVGERITLVWSLTEPQCGLDLTSLSRLFGATAARPGTRAQACTIEGEHCEHCTLTGRACHPSATAAMGFRKSGTAPDRPGQASVLRAFAKKSAAHLAWRRETMQRSQAASSDSHASLPAPGPLTDAAAIRSVHPPRRAVLDRGQAGRSSIDRPLDFGDYYY